MIGRTDSRKGAHKSTQFNVIGQKIQLVHRRAGLWDVEGRGRHAFKNGVRRERLLSPDL